MRNLDNVIKEYLSKETDYAIQIVGKWGNGKTYYYKNVLEKLIINKPIYINNNKKYKPIYISLFGLKSIEDISTKIVLEFYQSNLFKTYFNKEKRKLKITQSILKIGLRGFLNFHKLGNVNDYLTDIKKIGESVLDTNELVICFDDLERKDSDLNIEDLIGYINSLADERLKILIISNDDLLLKNDDKYKDLKEKIIGITIEFNPNPKQTIENIINKRYIGFPTYKKYLDENIDLILKISQSIDNNFRHIIYALDCFQNCYSHIKNNIIDIKHDINKKLIEELQNITILSLAFSIDYKATIIKQSDKGDFLESKVLFNKMIDKGAQPKPIDNKNNYDNFIKKSILS